MIGSAPPIPLNRLAVSSWCWGSAYYDGRFSLLDLPRLARTRGLTLVEANDFMLPPPPLSRITRPFHQLIPGHNDFGWRIRRRSLHQFQQKLLAEGVRCIGWTLNTDFTRHGVKRWGEAIYQSGGLMAAEILNVPRLRINAGGETNTPLTPSVIGQAAAFVQRALNRLPTTTIVLENHWGLSSNLDQHLRFFSGVQEQLPAALRPRFLLCVDPDNLPAGDPRLAWKKMAPAAGHLHLKQLAEDKADPDGKLPTWLDFVATIHALKPQYAGYYVLEDERLLDQMFPVGSD